MAQSSKAADAEPLIKLIETLSNAYGVSGEETEVRRIIMEKIKHYVDECTVDKMGNLICRKAGGGMTIFLTAHMDEIGLMVSRINDQGYIFFTAVGGIEPITLISQRSFVQTKKGKLYGVITCEELHNGKSIARQLRLEDLYLDTGLSRKELQEAGVKVGDIIIPVVDFVNLGNNKIISGKALDDRLGCAALIEIARRMKNAGDKNDLNIFYIFTVQEENGLVGARISLKNIEPVWGLAVDTTICNDSGKEKILGNGPMITIKDSELIANRCLVEDIQAVAEKKKIPYQLEAGDTGTTDAFALSLSKGGIPVGVIVVPLRNIHSTISVAHLDDIENAIKLVEALLYNPPTTCVR